MAKQAADNLLAKARAGNVAALGELLEKHRDYLRVLARSALHKRIQARIDASDVVQETLKEAVQDFGHFRGDNDAQLVCWLRRILSRNLADQVKHHEHAGRRSVDVERELEADVESSSVGLGQMLAAAELTPSQAAMRRERDEQLATAIEQLPEHYRTVIILRHLQGMTFPEIAGLLARSLDSVEHQWARAIQELRRLLGAACD